MNDILNFIKNNKYNLFLAVAWLIITVITMFHHELWRDEAQVWCLVRDADLITIIKEIQTEGHPYLWYLMNLPFAKLGFPVISMQIIGLIFVFSAVLLVLFKSPFNRFLKFLILFNAGMLYFLPIVARNYALISFFMFAIATVYHKRHDKPLLYLFLLFCLSQTHSLMLCFVWILLLLFTFEYIKSDKKNNSVNFFIFLSFLNILFLTIMPILNIEKNLSVSLFKNHLNSFSYFKLLTDIFYVGFLSNIFEKNIFECFFIALTSIFAIIIISVFKCDKKIGSIFFFYFIYTVIILFFIWGGGIIQQKVFLILLCNIFCLWILENKECFIYKKILEISLSLFLLFFLSYTPFMIKNEYISNFSGGKEIASYIKNNLSSESIILFYGYIPTISSISAYLPNVKIYSFDNEKYISFFKFSFNDKTLEPDTFPTNAKYIISSKNFNLTDNNFFVETDISLSGENYYLYRFENKDEFVSLRNQ